MILIWIMKEIFLQFFFGIYIFTINYGKFAVWKDTPKNGYKCSNC